MRFLRPIRLLGTDTSWSTVYEPKRKSIVVIQPFGSRAGEVQVRTRRQILWFAEEANWLAHKAGFRIKAGPSLPIGGWDVKRLKGLVARNPAGQIETSSHLLPSLGVPTELKSVEEERAMTLGWTDPLWNDAVIRRQFAESSVFRTPGDDPYTLMGKGKVAELAVFIARSLPQNVFINASLSATQQTQLEELLYNAVLAVRARRKHEHKELRMGAGERGPEIDQLLYDARSDGIDEVPDVIDVIDRNQMILRAHLPSLSAVPDRYAEHMKKCIRVQELRFLTSVPNSLPVSAHQREVSRALTAIVGPYKLTPRPRDGAIIEFSNSTAADRLHDTMKLRAEMGEIESRLDRTRMIDRNRSNFSGPRVLVVGYDRAGTNHVLNAINRGTLIGVNGAQAEETALMKTTAESKTLTDPEERDNGSTSRMEPNPDSIPMSAMSGREYDLDHHKRLVMSSPEASSQCGLRGSLKIDSESGLRYEVTEGVVPFLANVNVKDFLPLRHLVEDMVAADLVIHVKDGSLYEFRSSEAETDADEVSRSDQGDAHGDDQVALSTRSDDELSLWDSSGAPCSVRLSPSCVGSLQDAAILQCLRDSGLSREGLKQVSQKVIPVYLVKPSTNQKGQTTKPCFPGVVLQMEADPKYPGLCDCRSEDSVRLSSTVEQHLLHSMDAVPVEIVGRSNDGSSIQGDEFMARKSLAEQVSLGRVVVTDGDPLTMRVVASLDGVRKYASRFPSDSLTPLSLEETRRRLLLQQPEPKS